MKYLSFVSILLCTYSGRALAAGTIAEQILVEFRYENTVIGSLRMPREYRIFVENGSTKKVGDKIVAATQDGTAMNAYISLKKYGEEEVWKHWVLTAHVGHNKYLPNSNHDLSGSAHTLEAIKNFPDTLALVAEAKVKIDGIEVKEVITREKPKNEDNKYSYADLVGGVSKCAFFDLEMDLKTPADPPDNLTLEKIREQTKPLMDIIKTYKVSYDGCPVDTK